MKYSLSPREIRRAKPEGFPEALGYISSYFLNQVTIQTFSITNPALIFQEINTGIIDSPYCFDRWVIQKNIAQ